MTQHIKQLALVCLLSVGMGLPLAATPESNKVTAVRPTDANIIGHVVDAKTKEHLPGITILIKGTNFGATTDKTGHYFIKNLKPGRHTLVMRGMGFLSQERTIEISRDQTLEINFEAEQDQIHLDEVVVSSNRQATLRRLAPTLVNVLSGEVCKITNANNLAQGLTFQPGVRVENNCQNCGFNQVRINGLDGRYSQILIDSRPIMNALSGVYGLEQLPTNMVERVEVVRGGGSALYGSSAIAGVVNIITKEPTSNAFSFSESLTLTGMKKPDNNITINGSMVSDNGKIGATMFAQTRQRAGWDADADGFTEIGKVVSRSFGTRAFLKTTDYSKLTAEFHTLSEYRRGGDHLDWPDHVAAVAERINHSIYSTNAKWDLFSQDYLHHFQVYGSAQVVDRDSYYGGLDGDWEDNYGTPGNPVPREKWGVNYGVTKSRTYNAGAQYSYDMDHFLFMPAQVLVGAEYTRDFLTDTMPIRYWSNDRDPAKMKYPNTNQLIHNWSQLAQIEWKSEMFNLLLGARLDENSLLKKPILSPRAALRYAPTRDLNFRLAYAKGFRAPQVFDEDLHVGVVGGDAQKISNDENLRPEISHSVNLSGEYFFGTPNELQGNILVEGFFNRVKDGFNNEFLKEEDGIKHFVRRNTTGAKVYGVNLEGRIAYQWAQLQAGFTIASSLFDNPEEWGVEAQDNDGNKLKQEAYATLTKPDIEGANWKEESLTSRQMTRTPSTYGYFTLSLNPVKPFTFAVTGTYTGRMYVPHAIVMGNDATPADALNKGVEIAEDAGEIHADELGHTPSFFDLGARASYSFTVADIAKLELFAGMHNLLNSFQKDYDKGPSRDSAYIYGPLMPRSLFMGLRIDF